MGGGGGGGGGLCMCVVFLCGFWTSFVKVGCGGGGCLKLFHADPVVCGVLHRALPLLALE